LRRGAGGTERPALPGAERHPSLGDLEAVADTGIERGLESQDRDQLPDHPESQRLNRLRRDLLQQRQRVAQAVVALGMRVRRRETDHHLREHRSRGVAVEVGRQSVVEVEQVERGERVELAVLLSEQLRLALAQELERGAEPAPGAQCALSDGALHPCSRVASRTILEVSL
jgi:hypothetical protein